MSRPLIISILVAAGAAIVVLFYLLAQSGPRTEYVAVVKPPSVIAPPPTTEAGSVRHQGRVQGTVIYGPTGKPLQGATVVALAPYLQPGEGDDLPLWGEMLEKTRVKTGPDGKFDIEDLPPDYWNLWVEKKNFGFATVPRADFATDHKVVLWPACSVTGKVVFEDESPASGVHIEYTPQGTHSEVFSRYRLKSYYTKTKKDGTFEYRDLPPGKFTIEVYPDEHLPAPYTAEPPLQPGENRQLKIRKLYRGFGMTVFVKWRGTNEPVPDIEVAIRPVGDPMPRTKVGRRRRTDQDGIARFSGLGGQVIDKPRFLVTANIGGEPVMPDEGGMLEPDGSVTIYARRQCAITGRVLGADGDPLPRFFLELIPKGFITTQLRKWETHPDNGRFSMEAIPEGDYTLTVRFPGLVDAQATVHAVAGQKTDVGTIRLMAGAEIWGNVTRAGGKEIKGVVRVALARRIRRPGHSVDEYVTVARTVVQKDGSYRMRGLPNGTFYIQPVQTTNLGTTKPELITVNGASDSIRKDMVMHGSGFVALHYFDTVRGSRIRVVAVPTYLIRKADGNETRWWGSGSSFRPGVHDIQVEMKNSQGVPTRYTAAQVTIQEERTAGPIELSLDEIRNAD